MDPQACIARVHELLAIAQVSGQWHVVVASGMGRRLGTCDYSAKRIRISTELLRLGSAEQIEDTLRHEVAHALARQRFGPGIKPHGAEWKACARLLGATPRASVPQHLGTFVPVSQRGSSRSSRGRSGQVTSSGKGQSVFFVPALNREIRHGDVFEYRSRRFHVIAPKRTRFTASTSSGTIYTVPASLLPLGTVIAGSLSSFSSAYTD